MKENNNDDATEVDIGPLLKAYPEHQWLWGEKMSKRHHVRSPLLHSLDSL
jgi:hypothetical protein